jgi:hypothetical protein
VKESETRLERRGNEGEKKRAVQLMGGDNTDRGSPAIKSVRERGCGDGGKRDKK